MANDASPTRSHALVKNLERAGVSNAVILTEQPKKLAERFPGFFDRILVDAPCSGEGMFRRDLDAVKAYTTNKPDACVTLQNQILHHAATMLKPGGRMVYSTCTFNPIENERVIATFLASHSDFDLLPIDHTALGISHGRPEWANRENKLAYTARIWPHLAPGEGHFIALLLKKGDSFTNYSLKTKAGRRPKEYKLFELFCKEYLNSISFNGNFVTHGVSLYLQPDDIDLKGLRVARSGLRLGEVLHKRFEPSQALAMLLGNSANTNIAKYIVELPEDLAWRYLKGESLDLPANFDIPEGKQKHWVLITHLGLSLGWAKLVQGRLKNHLPVGWVV